MKNIPSINVLPKYVQDVWNEYISICGNEIEMLEIEQFTDNVVIYYKTTYSMGVYNFNYKDNKWNTINNKMINHEFKVLSKYMKGGDANEER